MALQSSKLQLRQADGGTMQLTPAAAHLPIQAKRADIPESSAAQSSMLAGRKRSLDAPSSDRAVKAVKHE